LTKKPNKTSTKKTKLDVDKKMHNYMLTEKRKKKKSQNTVLTPTHRQKPTHESPTAAGMRKYNRSRQPKKNPFFD
jgi:hypothetical protein